MKKILLLLILAVPIVSNADCMIRMHSRIKNSDFIGPPTDIQKMVVPDGTKIKCILRYRRWKKTNWITAEGVVSADSEDKACMLALDASNGYQLNNPESIKISSVTDMICSNFKPIKVHTVQIGDVVYESETEMHVIPDEKPYFSYKRSVCRFFVERHAIDQDLIFYQGVICRQTSSPDSKWLVVDKF